MLSTRLLRAMVIAALVNAPTAGFAQDVGRSALDAYASATPQDLPNSADENPEAAPDPDQTALANALNTELLPLLDARQKSPRLPDLGAREPTWSKTRNSDG